MTDLIWPDDASVAADPELQAFLRDLSSHHGGRLRGVPEVHTRAHAAHLVAVLIFTASAQHSAVNFPQFRFMSWPPNMPGALWAAVPDAATPNTEAAFHALLPPTKVMMNGATMVYLLSNLRMTTLGRYAPGHFLDPRVAPLLLRFQAELSRIDNEIAAVDGGRYLPYPYLRPSQILQSISI